jgi:hypothetical protein
MTLRWKIDDELRFDEASIARYDVPALAGRLVGFRVGGPFALELERDALAHNADRVDGVHYRVDALLQQVARRDLEDHGSLSIIPAGPHLQIERDATLSSLSTIREVLDAAGCTTVDRIRNGSFKQACEAADQFADTILKLSKALSFWRRSREAPKLQPLNGYHHD